MKSPKERPLQIENFYINRLRGKTKTAAAVSRDRNFQLYNS